MKTICFLLLTLFSQANQYYADGEWDAAAKAYEQCLSDTTNSDYLTLSSRAEIYYNLGNARFKQGELSQSILAYERCLRLSPRHKDARFNLTFAQSRIVDNIEDNRNFFIASWAEAIRNIATCRQWTIVAIVMFITMLVALLLFAFSPSITMRKLAFYTALLSLVVCIAAAANAYSLFRRDTQRREAIITQGIVNAKASPDRNGTDLFVLHEGTKVEIVETIGEWGNILVGNNEGWIALKNLERI